MIHIPKQKKLRLVSLDKCYKVERSIVFWNGGRAGAVVQKSLDKQKKTQKLSLNLKNSYLWGWGGGSKLPLTSILSLILSIYLYYFLPAS